MERTPKIIFFPDHIKSACSFWRISPLFELAREGHIEIMEGIYTLEDWVKLRQNDIAFFQRPMSKNVKDQVFMAKDLGLKIIIDLDDFNHIPPHHPVYDIWVQEYDGKVFEKIMMMADIVTTTTESLQKHYLTYHNNVVVVPNAINEWLPFDTFSWNKSIILRAGTHHLNDIWEYHKEIIEVMEENKDWKLHITGGEVKFLEDNIENLEATEDLAIHQYFAFILRTHPSIFIVPLYDDELNRSKSNISWLEATLVGASALTPDFFNLQDYSLTYKNKKTFKSQFKRLISNEKLRKSLYDKSYVKVKDEYILSKVNKQRLEIIKNLMK